MLPDKENPTERRCPNPGIPYCPEHDVELHYHVWLELRDYVATKNGPQLVKPHI